MHHPPVTVDRAAARLRASRPADDRDQPARYDEPSEPFWQSVAAVFGCAFAATAWLALVWAVAP